MDWDPHWTSLASPESESLASHFLKGGMMAKNTWPPTSAFVVTASEKRKSSICKPRSPFLQIYWTTHKKKKKKKGFQRKYSSKTQLISCLQTSTQSAHFFTHTSISPIWSSSHKYPQFSTEEGNKRKKNAKNRKKTPHKNMLLKADCSLLLLLLLLLAPWSCQVQRNRRLVVQSPSMICDPQTRPKKTTNSNTESDESWGEC